MPVDDADKASCEGEENGFKEELKQDRFAAGSDGPAHANLLAALGDANQRHAHDHDTANASREYCDDHQQLAIVDPIVVTWAITARGLVTVKIVQRARRNVVPCAKQLPGHSIAGCPCVGSLQLRDQHGEEISIEEPLRCSSHRNENQVIEASPGWPSPACNNYAAHR